MEQALAWWTVAARQRVPDLKLNVHWFWQLSADALQTGWAYWARQVWHTFILSLASHSGADSLRTDFLTQRVTRVTARDAHS